MVFGVQLAGTAADGAALAVLMESSIGSALAESPWSLAIEIDGAGSVLVSPEMPAAWAEPLALRGLDVVTLTEVDGALVGAPLRDGHAGLRWGRWRWRAAPRLLEALRPRRIAGEPLAEEALFVMRPDSPGPRRLLERLLLLERGDAQVCSFVGVDAAEHGCFAVRVKAPPMYLLMAARDGEDDIAVYARAGGSPLWVAWSYEHPLAGAAAAALGRVGQVALCDGEGAWLRTDAQWRVRGIHDAVAPELVAGAVALRSVEPDLRFRVRLRLAPGPICDAELWLLSPGQLLELEPLIDACTADELGRLTVGRLTGDCGTVYLLRERVRPGAARMAVRVSDTLGVPGYAQVAGADNLYIPSGRRLVPLLRRDDLRALLGLERAHTVVITEDRDGPKVVTIAEVDEAPLQRWIDYVATDRRLELDRLLERSVFEFPEVSIAWPELQRAAPERAPREARAAKVLTKPPARIEVVTAELSVDAEQAAQLRALRERARELERVVIAGGCEDIAVWRELGEVKLALGEEDEAADCWQLALLHGGPPYALVDAERLVLAMRGAGAGAGISDDALIELVVADRRTPADSGRLAAMLVARLAAGRPPPDEVMQLALPVFLDPRLPVPRRLAWTVLAGWHHHARDRLGVTRAKEALLGGINVRGLSELHDLPRFVRYALTREGEEAETEAAEARGDRLQQGQLLALEALWHDVYAAGLPDLDARANYLRLIFAVGFARLGARSLAQELVAPIELELDVHEVPNRALFRLYMARLAHEGSGGTSEVWAEEVARALAGQREAKHRAAVQWLQRRSLWLRVEADEALVGRPTRYELPQGLDVGGLAEQLARELAPGSGNFDFILAEAVDLCLRRALASGSEAVVAEVLASAEPGLEGIQILSHRAEAIAACIHGAACLGDDALLGRLLDGLVAIVRSPQLASAQELTRAVERGLVALRRFGGIEPARGLLEALAGVHAQTASDRVRLLATVASGFVQLGEDRSADALLDQLCDEVLAGGFDYVTRAQAGMAVAGALRHWPNVARIERFRRFLAGLDVFRDTFTAGRYYETHRILILEAVVDSLADSKTRHSDRVQGFLDHEEHALRRRIVRDWGELCGR
ncbi:hypothetical protein [Nannocystis sp.]|uniref:hypothetical protein n=1 Tax=Nannocystis sp. TaxID=1962667 RepID=UPI0025E3A934|nr:hypothetical protein [Nannocystis sp.]MBK7825760.1 hypothetical protein [Nannocystis sp.]